jgi:zinc protease
MKKALLIFSLIFCFSSAVRAKAADLPVPEIETLPNGLKVVWFVNSNLPLVDVDFVFRSGSRDDLPGKSGTAALMSRALERGAGGMTAQQIAKAIEALGASRFEVADDDTFSVGIHGLAPDAVTFLDLLSKLVLQPEFPEAEVEREKARMLEEWNHTPDYQESLVDLAYRRLLSLGTSYWRGELLSEKEFKKVHRDDLLKYYHDNITPKNGLLMVVGRVDKVAFKKEIEKLFGDWKGEEPKHDYPIFQKKYKVPAHAPVIVFDRPDSTQTQVRIGFRSPDLKDPRHYALAVANALLGEYFNSRLNTLIRDKLGLTYSISSAFSYSENLATFSIVSATRTDAVGQLIKKTMGVLQDLKRGPIPSDEIQMAKDYLIGGFPLSTSTLGSVASRWMTGYLFDLSPSYLNEFVPKVNAVTTEEVVKAVDSAFDLDHLVIAVSGDAAEIEKSLAAQKIPYRRVSTETLMNGKVF